MQFSTAICYYYGLVVIFFKVLSKQYSLCLDTINNLTPRT